MIEEVFNKYGVGFISIRESFDTTTPFGKAMIGILSVFAQLERETIIERTRIGMRKRVEDGYWRGGGKIPFVYDYDKKTGILTINPERKIIFDMMKSLRLQGASYNLLETITGIDQAWIQTILNCKTNLGLIPYKGKVYEGRHKAVITQQEFNELQKIEKNRRHSKRASNYLLSGKLYCGYCGAKFRYQKWGQRTVCYCYSQQKSKPKLVKDPNCCNKRLDSYEIEDVFLNELFKMSLNEDRFNDTFDLTQSNIQEELLSRLDKIQKQIDNLLNYLSECPTLDDIKIKIDELVKEREDVSKKLKENPEKKEVKLYNDVKNLSLIWNQMQFIEKRNIVETLLDKIIIEKDKLKIYWRISQH